MLPVALIASLMEDHFSATRNRRKNLDKRNEKKGQEKDKRKIDLKF